MIPLPLATALAFLVGLVFGSFLNVCIYRLPLSQSLLAPASHCPGCDARIRWYDNIPLVSFLVLQGRCRACGQRIHWQYPTVELLSGILSGLLLQVYQISWNYVIFFILTCILIVISFIDLENQIIPDMLSVPGLLLGWLLAFVRPDLSVLEATIGVLAGGGSLWLIAAVYGALTGQEGLGGGDIKLLAMIGAWVGWRYLPLVVLIAAGSGALVGLIYLLVNRKGLRTRIPFGPFLAVGCLTCVLAGKPLVAWYLGLFARP